MDSFCLGHLLFDRQCGPFPSLVKFFCLTHESCRFPMCNTEIPPISYVWLTDSANFPCLTWRIPALCHVASGLLQHFPFTYRCLDNSEAFIVISKLIVSRSFNLNRNVSTLCHFMCFKWILELYVKFSWILMTFPDFGHSLLFSLRIWWKCWNRFPFARICRTVREAL